ncbi:MAG: DUF1302 family protein [Gammaproteobacteria bacterium]|jgi:hypothetical protein|nr:DUF1302 family protein [Gammaproteobacteria bacterium]
MANNWHVRALAMAIASAATVSGGAWAMPFETGNPDLEVRFDNTIKYNLMSRVESQDKDVTNSANPNLFDDADLGFDKGIVSNRFDLLSELEVVWKQNFGFRVSAASWHDQAYGDSNDHPGLNKDFRINGNYTDTWGLLSAPPGEYNDFADNQAHKDVELMDAFVFANFSVGGSEASVRAGRHTLYWGQSLFASGATNGIAGAMAPIDQARGLGVPGSEAKELFLPTNKLSGSFQVNQNLSLVGYYSFEWEPVRYSAPGTYFALSEISMDHAEFLTLVPGQVDPATGALVAPRTGYVQDSSEEPDDGEWGAGLQYVFTNGLELGVYYLNYHDKAPQGVIGALNVGQYATAQATTNPTAALLVALWPAYSGGVPPDQFGYYTGGGYPAVGIGRFKWTYREDNELFGISLGKEIAGVSVGMDLAYRNDVAIDFNSGTLLHTETYPDFGALQATVAATLAAAGFPTDNFDFDGADGDNYAGATGDVWTLVVNGVGFLDPGALWDGGSYAVEMTFAALTAYGDNEQLASKYIDENDIATTIGLSFAPQWYQVMPSLDLKLPFTLSYGINGHSPLRGGGDADLGIASIGLSFEYQQVWTIDTKYNMFFGEQENGSLGNLIDRDNVALTIKRTF